MLTARIKIGTGSGEPVDTQTYGLVYLSSAQRVGSPIKGYDATSYPEEEGEHIIPKTVDDAFDYVVKFFIRPDAVGPNDTDAQKKLKTVNAKIKAFNEAILPFNSTTGQRTANLITFYNDYKRHMIVGYPQPMAEAEDFWRDPKNQVNDIVIVEWTIRVTKPSLCDYNI